MSQRRPLISVILATHNEAAQIRPCIASLLAQDTSDFNLEILVVDGLSKDGTREFLDQIASTDPRVRVLANERMRAPFAFNIGLREAKGEFVCVFGSHTIYKSDYISVCWKDLLATGAAGCGGRVLTQPAVDTLQARLVASALAHPFGSSAKSFRTQAEGFADTVNYMVIRKQPLIDVGGYSEVLTRNQDNDTNQKLRAAGYKLFCTWKTQCVYHPKETLRGLLVYAFRNGFWNVISFRENKDSMAVRHFFPFLFVLSLLSSLFLAASSFRLDQPIRTLAALLFPGLLLLHLGVGAFAALQVLWRERYPGFFWLPPVFLGFHLSYGIGTLVAFVTRAKVSHPAAVHAKKRSHPPATGQTSPV